MINRKHEMFWNQINNVNLNSITEINRKHEMFWNYNHIMRSSKSVGLTVNMKCFEIMSIMEKYSKCKN